MPVDASDMISWGKAFGNGWEIFPWGSAYLLVIPAWISAYIKSAGNLFRSLIMSKKRVCVSTQTL